jgi:hypothetical protein
MSRDMIPRLISPMMPGDKKIEHELSFAIDTYLFLNVVVISAAQKWFGRKIVRCILA